MADSDSSSYILRFDVASQKMQYFSGSNWYDVPDSGSGGSPAGDDTQLQFNDNGDFGASTDLTWDGIHLNVDTIHGSTLSNPAGTVVIASNTGSVTVLADQGLIIPDLTTGERDALMSPTEGTIIMNTSSHALNYFDGTDWQEVAKV